MKKIYIFLIVYVLLGISIFIPLNLFSPTDINGSVKTLEHARRLNSEHYENVQILHTVNNEDRCVDIVMTNDEGKTRIRSISYERTDKWSVSRYSFKEMSEKSLKNEFGECVNYFVQTGEVRWIETVSGGNRTKYMSVLWAVLDPIYEVQEPNVSALTFECEGQQYVLYVKNETNY